MGDNLELEVIDMWVSFCRWNVQTFIYFLKAHLLRNLQMKQPIKYYFSEKMSKACAV